MKKTNAWETLTATKEKAVDKFAKEYMDFLDASKTERTCAKEIIKQAKENGFEDLDALVKKGKKLVQGQKVFAVNREKSVALFVIGKNSLENGFNLVGSHIDSPRLDLKQNPLYEDGNMALLKTHYYGGVKKYQWATIPLALYGVAFDENGKKVEISIGDDEKDPVFFINDLLIHLSADQLQKKASEVINGEQLNVVVGNKPAKNVEKEPIKNAILDLLKKKYNLSEKSFLTAEFEIVPAGKAREVGFDRSMIAAYGHDDRVCAFTSLKAILDVKKPVQTACAIFMDKEEVGSQGNTGMESKFFENCLAELIALEGGYCELKLKRAFKNGKVLSADVNCCLDPSFPEATEKNNTATLGDGVVLTKYTGSRGKGGCSDANAEYLHEVATVFDKNKVVWQTGELGKVDQGGGGTIAYILANYGAEVVDCGTPVLSMHAPHELVSKIDVYMTYQAYYHFSK
ncbi:MAG: aminopeptidase [Peptostreptococcaceae bacterium]|nr:aminopeptidase [Peptostreptococcaceae bacterium]